MPRITVNVPQDKMAAFFGAIDALGLDIDQGNPDDIIPDWHKQIVEERKREYLLGNSGVTSWDDFKKELDSDNEGGE